jgi:hypothetical protein
MANLKNYSENEKKILLDNLDCDIERFLNMQKIDLELLNYYILNKEKYDQNDCNILLQDIISLNLIILKKYKNEKSKK